jgi:hypothetical protein
MAGDDSAAIDWYPLTCANDLPGFVNDFGFRGFKWRPIGTVRMETPVMYFYSSSELTARVKVAFPQGLITEWYPQAEYAVYQDGARLSSRTSSRANRDCIGANRKRGSRDGGRLPAGAGAVLRADRAA